MEDLLRQLIQQLDDISKNMVTKEDIKHLATAEEVGRVAETLEMIATGEVAAAKAQVEDKIDARDVLTKSLIDGLESRINAKLEEGFRSIAESQEKILKTMGMFIEKFEQQDDLNDLVDKRLKEQERSTLQIRRRLKELGGDVGQ